MSSVSSSPVRWGILATGKIAHSFASDLALVPDNVLVAVGSRSAESRASVRGAVFQPVGAGSSPPLVRRPCRRSRGRRHLRRHAAWPARRRRAPLLRVRQGRALREGADAGDVVDRATRGRGPPARPVLRRGHVDAHQPQHPTRRAAAHEGACGTIAQVRAELGFVAPPDVDRLWDPALGASALLDVGIYPLTFAHLVLGEPDDVAAAGTLSDRGIDVGGGATLTYPGGAVASLAWTQMAWSDNRAAVAGDGGRLEIPSRFHEATGFTYRRRRDPRDPRRARHRTGLRPRDRGGRGLPARPAAPSPTCSHSTAPSPSCGCWTRSATSSGCGTS